MEYLFESIPIPKHITDINEASLEAGGDMVDMDDVRRHEIKLANAKNVMIAFNKAVQQRYYDYFAMKIKDGEFDELIPMLKKVNADIEESENNKCNKTAFMFITINPDNKTTLEAFRKKINKLLTKVWIEQYLYVIEQRGVTEDEIGKGMHCHILVYHDNKKKYSEFSNEIKNTFKNICMVDNIHCLNFKNVQTQESLDNRLNYMIGIKKEIKDANKALKQSFDIPFRTLNNIESFYTNDLNFFKNSIV